MHSQSPIIHSRETHEETAGQLTHYPVGSMRELWTIAYPLMLSLFSLGMMIFFDRYFLARLSEAAFNGSSEGSMFFSTMEIGIQSFALIGEVFVGRAFGARKLRDVPNAVWVLVWFSLASAILFCPVAVWGTPYLFASSRYPEEAGEFFRTLSFFGPLIPLNCALMTFWSGRGKTRFITAANVFANLVNIALDPLLIFGLGLFPRLEIAGAGVATGSAQLILTAVLLVAFLSEGNRTTFGTGNFRIRLSVLKETLFLGLPQSLSQLSLYAAWAFLYRLMGIESPDHLFIMAICHAAFLVCNFFFIAVSEAGTAIAANLIGAGRAYEIRKVSLAGVKIHCLFALVSGAFFLAFGRSFLQAFLPPDAMPTPATWHSLTITLWVNWLSFMGEALMLLWAGFLIAFKDARFIFVTSALGVWLAGCLPAAFALTVLHTAPHTTIAIGCLYYFVICSMYCVRLNKYLKRTDESFSMAKTGQLLCV